jgi:hypothetical protein
MIRIRSKAEKEECQRPSSQDAAPRPVAIESMDSKVAAAAGPRLVKQSQPNQVGAMSIAINAPRKFLDGK